MGRLAAKGLLWAGLGLYLLACGGGAPGGAPPDDAGDQVTGGGEPVSAAQPDSGAVGTEEALAEAATESFVAFADGDYQTYFNLLSRQCRERLGFFRVSDYLSGRSFMADVGGIDLKALAVADVQIEAFAGDRADVSLVVSGTEETFRESLPHRWIFEEDGWRLADCDHISEPTRPAPPSLGTNRNDPVPEGWGAEADGWIVTVRYWRTTGFLSQAPHPPAEGNELVPIEVGIMYDGPEVELILGDAWDFALVTPSAVYGEESACRSSGLPYFDFDQVFGPGDSVWVSVCREMPAGEADHETMLLRATYKPTGVEFWLEIPERQG